MAASFINNARQVNFDSVLGFPDNEGMVNMFKSLESTGLHGCLGCPSVLYEDDLVSFFANILVKDNEAGSFDAVTHERFLLMTTINFGVKVDWSKLLFDILKEMADQSSKRAKGYAAQIFVLLKGDPNLTLGEAKTFPPLKILTIKTVGTYVAKNKNIADDETDEPVAAKEAVVKKKAVSKIAIHFGVKVNWSKLLFDILKEMADQSSKRAKGYASQIFVLLKGDPNLTLGDC
ncbi:hypothetical protein F511_25350 [Dorcoceras hygrometricum]|uniref:Uncharacterized protein n=1 Tax=Dorcoceras hygrometricum TaxID=472368 RepID=A0A2Z7CLX5_9LAMI|nr:hypothetical protein F511_25350 [Dorcoceras hygrometricum]